MDVLKLLLIAFLGGKSKSPAWTVDGNDIWSAIRNAVIVALIVGGISSIEFFNAKDWGVVDTLVAALASGAVEFLRKLRKDYENLDNETPSEPDHNTRVNGSTGSTGL